MLRRRVGVVGRRVGLQSKLSGFRLQTNDVIYYVAVVFIKDPCKNFSIFLLRKHLQMIESWNCVTELRPGGRVSPSSPRS